MKNTYAKFGQDPTEKKYDFVLSVSKIGNLRAAVYTADPQFCAKDRDEYATQSSVPSFLLPYSFLL